MKLFLNTHFSGFLLAPTHAIDMLRPLLRCNSKAAYPVRKNLNLIEVEVSF